MLRGSLLVLKRDSASSDDINVQFDFINAERKVTDAARIFANAPASSLTVAPPFSDTDRKWTNAVPTTSARVQILDVSVLIP